jgi:hypothetical protein
MADALILAPFVPGDPIDIPRSIAGLAQQIVSATLWIKVRPGDTAPVVARTVYASGDIHYDPTQGVLADPGTIQSDTTYTAIASFHLSDAGANSNPTLAGTAALAGGLPYFVDVWGSYPDGTTATSEAASTLLPTPGGRLG